MSNFLIAFGAVFPFVFYMTFGFAAVKAKYTDEAFMNRLNQMVFKLFFPINMFYSIYNQRNNLHINDSIIFFSVGSTIAVILLAWLFVPLFVKENPRRGVVIQAIFRSNTVLFAIPLSENVFGTEGAALAATVIAVLIPIYNIFVVIILEYYRGGKVDVKDLIKKILTNPLILGAVTALVFIACKIEVPTMILKPLSQFAAMTTPLALFILGGTLKVSSVRKNMMSLINVFVIKMLVLPAIAVGISIFLNMSPLERFEYFVIFAAPVAVSSFPMAQNMGGDGDLAGELVVFTTIGSLFTIFLWILFMKTVCLI